LPRAVVIELVPLEPADLPIQQPDLDVIPVDQLFCGLQRYGTLIAWAEKLGHDEVVRFLTTNLNEEHAANTKLNTVAMRKGVNTKASNAA
jgi:hypothetical protein